MESLEADGDDLSNVIITGFVAFVLFCSGCFIVPATSVVFWLTIRHREIRRKPINWSIVNLAMVDFVFGAGVAIQSVSLVFNADALCKISGVWTNSMMTANLFSLAAIAAQFDGLNRLEEKILLRLSSGDEKGESPRAAFTINSVMMMNVGSWFYMFLAAVPLIVSPNNGPHVVGVCGSLPRTPSVLFSCHTLFVSSGIVTCSVIIAYYHQRLLNVVLYGTSRRISDISTADDLPLSAPKESILALRFLRVSFLSLIGSRAGWFIAEVLFRTMHNPFPLYVVRLLYLVTPVSSLVNPCMVLLCLEQYHQAIRGEEVASADRCGNLELDANALKRITRIDNKLLHGGSSKDDWRMQSASRAAVRHTLAPAHPLDVRRKSFSQTELLHPNYRRSTSKAKRRDSS